MIEQRFGCTKHMSVNPNELYPRIIDSNILTQKTFFNNIYIFIVTYLQIRRMIATLICVAIGKIPPEEVKVMLQIPSKHSWHSCIQNSPPDGLYLCNVEYNPEDLVYTPVDAAVEETCEETDSR